MNSTLLEKQLEPIFNEDVIYDLIEDYFVETNEDGEAKLTTLSNKQIFIQVMDVDRADGTRTVASYMMSDDKELYKKMDSAFRLTVKKNSFNEFWDMWGALMSVLDPEFLISRETFEV